MLDISRPNDTHASYNSSVSGLNQGTSSPLQRPDGTIAKPGIGSSPSEAVVLLGPSQPLGGLSSTHGASEVFMSRPNLESPTVAVDAKGYDLVSKQLHTLQGADADIPLDVALNSALIAMLQSSLDERKGVHADIKAQRLAMAGNFELQVEKIKAQGLYQFNAGLQKGASEMNAAANAIAMEIAMIILTVITAGAAAPVAAAASTGAKVGTEVATQVASKAASELGKGAVKEGVKDGVKGAAQDTLVQSTLSEAETTAVAKSVMSSAQQIVFQGPEQALKQNLIANYSAPIKAAIKNAIKEKLPQAFKDRLAKDVERAAAHQEAKAQAKAELQATRDAKGPQSTGQNISNALKDKAKNIAEHLKDWGRIDTSEIIDTIVDRAIDYAFRQAVDEITESRDAGKNVQKMNEVLAQVEKKTADVLGRAANDASEAVQMSQQNTDNIRQTISGIQDTMQQMMETTAQGDKRIIQGMA